MTHNYSELWGIKMYARETKHRLGDLYALLISNDLDIEVYSDVEILREQFDSAGELYESIVEACECELRRMDERREKIKCMKICMNPKVGGNYVTQKK